MPRKPRRIKQQRRPIDADQMTHLIRGWSMDVDPRKYGSKDGRFPFRDDVHRRQLWDENKERIMAGIADGSIHLEIGCRPFPVDKVPAAMADYEVN